MEGGTVEEEEEGEGSWWKDLLFFVQSDFAESAPLRGHLSVMRLQEASEAAVGGALWHRMSEMRHIRSYSFGTLELETLQPRGLAVAFTHV